MLDIDDDELDEQPRLRAPQLPPALEKKLFCLYQDFWHMHYPGPEIWGQLSDDARGPADFVDIRNPRETPVRLHFLIGSAVERQQMNFQVRCERLLVPQEYRASDGLMRKMLSRTMPIRLGYMRTLVTVAPGATATIPRHWLQAVRRLDKKGETVVAGMCPDIQVPELDGDTPPVLHDAFIDRAPAAVNPDRRRR